jgi:hypothetical protein
VQIGYVDPILFGQIAIADLAHSQTIERGHESDGFARLIGLVASRPIVC